MKKPIIFFTIAMLLLSASVFAQTSKTWTGAVSSAWSNANNWSPSGVPNATHNVFIPSAPANQPYIAGTSTSVCNNLTVYSGAQIWIASTTTNSGMLTVNGTATFSGNLTLQGNLSLTGKLVATNVVWNSGSSITTTVGARMEVSGNWTFASGSAINMNLCSVTFTGSGTSNIYSYSAASNFQTLIVNKTGSGFVRVNAASTSAMNINGTLNIISGEFSGFASINYVLKGDLLNTGSFSIWGTTRLEKASGTQLVQVTPGSQFNNLTIAAGASAEVSINNNLTINGNLTIQSGTLNPNEKTLTVFGNWINTAGPSNFIQGTTTGRVKFTTSIAKDGKTTHNFCNHTEHFNILEVENFSGGYFTVNSASAAVTCNRYDYKAGGMRVQAGTFTANDLVQSGISGYWGLQAGGTINITKVSGWVDLIGATLNITGGTFNVYGGTTDSYWPYTSASSITMSGGVLNFSETGIRIQSSPALTYSITGGTIMTTGSFSCYKADFNLTGGTVEMYGPSDASLYMIAGSTLNAFTINKEASKESEGDHYKVLKIDRETGIPLTDAVNRAQTVNLTNPVTFNGNFTLTQGTFNTNNHTIQAKSDWINNAGAGSFVSGTGRVVFNGGNYHQYCYNETFNILELNKALGGAFRLASGTSVTCAVYDWTAGSIDVLSGVFTALDLLDNGIFGGYYVNPGGTINLYQDGAQWVDLCGHITFTGGGSINVYGGSSTSYWPYNNNASITMNAGVLDFKDQGILIASGANTLTANISGGTIRTAGNFTCNRSDFNPAGGTVELYGSQNTSLDMNNGSIFNLNVNKTVANNVTLLNNTTLTGGLTINGGTLNINAKTLSTNGNSFVNNGGILNLNPGASLLIASTHTLNVNTGGILRAIGSAANPALISRNGASGYFNININNGGTISARNTRFHYVNPLRILSGGIIDNDNPFDYCQFRYCTTGMLLVENSQTVQLREVEFLTPASGYNVSKTVNSGRLTFRDAFGNYSGQTYENDPHNRVDWITTQPGLWTGAISTNWHTAGNWDDGVVPNATVDVTIPASAPYMPVLSSHAECKNLTLNGTLTINNPTLTVSGNAAIAGHLTLNNGSARFVVMGDLTWNAGSMASVNNMDAEMHVNGHFTYNAGSNVQLNNGTVRFKGGVNKNIVNHSVTGRFYHLVSEKTSGAAIDFNSASTQPLRIFGSLTTETGARFKASSGLNIELKENLISNGTIELDWPRLVLNGINQFIRPNVNDYFYHIDFNQSGTVTINTSNSDVLQVRGGISILSGVFNAGSSTIKLRSGWNNTAGATAFIPSSSRVIFEGTGNQEIYMDENFNIFEINKNSGQVLINSRVVTCNVFDWTKGQVKVANGGVFTAYDLANDGIVADFSLQSGSTVNLHQDIYQGVDLGGILSISGGSTVNVYGGNGWSQWPGGADASLYMADGTLDFKDQGINVNSMSPNTLTLDITGGTIRTSKGFFCNRSDFTPEAGTLELYGGTDAELTMEAGNLQGLTINKAVGSTVSLNSSGTTTVLGITTVESGTFKILPGKELISDHIYVLPDGTFWLTENTVLKITPSREFIIDGGMLKVHGTPANKAIIALWFEMMGEINMLVDNGGTISASNANFSGMFAGVKVSATGWVDPNHAFTNCTFEDSFSDGLLVIDNNQDLIIYDAHFPSASAPYNVQKNNNGGSITLRDATGAFAGQAFEYDPHNRIHWITTQPGLWTGAVSADWHTPGNWDDLSVPTASTHVTIPASAPYMPVISATANCNDLFLHGTLSITGSHILNINGSAEIYGQFTGNGMNSQINITGDIEWHEGSTANTSMNIAIYGNWSFMEDSQASFPSGLVRFLGGEDTYILSNSHLSGFNNVWINKAAGKKVTVLAVSNNTLIFNGYLEIFGGNTYFSLANITTRLKGNLLNAGMFIFNGTASFEKTSGTQQVQVTAGSSFNNLSIASAPGVQVTLDNHLTIYGNVAIQSGIFNPNEHTLTVYGDWINTAGPDHFTEGTTTGKVIFTKEIYKENKSAHNFCNHTEHFNILEVSSYSGGYFTVNNPSAVVSCNAYNRVAAGGVSVLAGTFTASDLLQDGIFGSWILQDGGTINLTQQGTNIDLNGTIIISGGEFNVFGGTGASYWPGTTNATITMSGGTLNIADNGILVAAGAANLTSSISGGTIKTTGGFSNYRPDFNPAGGTLDLYGDGTSFLHLTAGTLWNVNINKTDPESLVNLSSNLTAHRITVNSGVLKSWMNTSIILQDAYVYDNGTLWLMQGTDFKIKASFEFVANGGKLKLMGEPGNNVTIGRHGSGNISMAIANGGIISAIHTHFSNLIAGVSVLNTGLVNPDYAFTSCTFEHGFHCLLTIDNDQDLTIYDARFPTISAPKNVRKTQNQGSVTLKDASGAFAGETYEDDEYNRIHWSYTQPGLWTGAISTDWHTAGNWDDGIVPDASTNVYIPGNRSHMPLISNGTAYCRRLTVHGTLTIHNKTLHVANDAEIYGTLTMDHWQGLLEVQESIHWEFGSTANITANAYIRVFGDWFFNPGSNAQMNQGTALFAGNTSTLISILSDESWFNHVEIEKSGMHTVSFFESSFYPLNTNNLYVMANAGFISNSHQDIIVRGNVGSYGIMTMNEGSLILAGADPIIAQNINDHYHNLVFNHTGTATINTVNTDVLNVTNDIVIISGVFEAGACTVRLGGSWDNQIGAGSFDKGTSRVVFNGIMPQFCSSENFHILEIDKSLQYLYLQTEANITCDSYDWTDGGLWIAGNATFIANDLADDGIYGFLHLFEGYVELHQDDQQSVDLRGELMISGGEMKVFGGNDLSRWGMYAGAQLTMSGGVLDFGEIGVNVGDGLDYDFTSEINGGIIRTMNLFWVQSEGFNPTGGIVELYGDLTATAHTSEGGSFWNLHINKPEDFSERILVLDAKVRNNLVVNQGLVEVPFGRELEVWNAVEVMDGGWLALTSSALSMKNLASLSVFENGIFSSFGYEGGLCQIKGITPDDIYTFSILSGGHLEATYTVFQDLPIQGVYIAPGALVNPYYSFTNCEFKNGTTGASTLLTIDNNQDLIIENAIFPTNTWGGQYNVRKNFDTGTVIFINATGDFAGEAFEDDVFNRIFWGEEVPLTLDLNGITMADGESDCFDAQQTITVSDFVVMDGGSATLIAGQNIVFLPGTYIQHGGYMYAFITKSGEFCSLQKSMLAVADEELFVTKDKAPLLDMLPAFAKDEAMFRVFPNPTTGMFTLELTKTFGDQTLSMEIYTLVGERVISEQLFGDTHHQFDLSFRPKGIYIVRVTVGDQVGIEKLVKH